MTLAEWCLFQTVRHFLDPEVVGTRPARPKHKSLTAVADDLAMVLGTMAYLTDEDTDRAFNRGSAMLELPLRLPEGGNSDCCCALTYLTPTESPGLALNGPGCSDCCYDLTS